MVSSRSRLIAGILSIVLLAACLLGLSSLSDTYTPGASKHLNTYIAAIAAFNIPILLAWISFGLPGGIAVTFFSIITVIFFNLRMGLYSYHAFTLNFFITSSIGYIFLAAKNVLNQTYALRSEKLEEETNLLNNAFKETNANIDSLEQKLVRYQRLKGVSESLSTVLSLDDIGDLIVKETAQTIGKAGRILLYLAETAREDLMLSASRDEERVKTKKGDVFDHWVFRNRKSLFIEDITKDFRFSADDIESAKPVFKSLIAQPIISQNRVIGILRLDSAREFEYTQDDLRLLDIISDLGAVAIQNGLLYARTQELAIRDSLTGLVLRRYFLERFHNEIKRSARKREHLSILMIDIDHFKEYNDIYGHAAGDLVLKHMAKTLGAMVEEGSGLVGRYGGEELVVLLSDRSARDAVAVAEKMRGVIKNAPLVLRRKETRLTVSIGVASYPEDAISEEELMRIADSRLYKAKTEGRDRVCSK